MGSAFDAGEQRYCASTQQCSGGPSTGSKSTIEKVVAMDGIADGGSNVV